MLNINIIQDYVSIPSHYISQFHISSTYDITSTDFHNAGT